MEEKKSLTGSALIDGVIGILIIGVLQYLIDHSFVWIAIYGAIAVVIMIVYILSNTFWKSTEAIESDICKRLDKAGYRYEKKEGTLYVFKNNNRFEIQLFESFNKRIKHLFVLYKFKDDNLVKVTTEGWCRAANCINIRNTEIIFVALEDHFCCCYQAAIGNARDFLKEFDLAYQTISEAMEDYGNLFPYLERDYPNQTGNKNSIGYKQDEP